MIMKFMKFILGIVLKNLNNFCEPINYYDTAFNMDPKNSNAVVSKSNP